MPVAKTPASATQTLIILFEQVITHIGGDDALLQKLQDAKDAFDAEFKADEAATAALADRVTKLEEAPASTFDPTSLTNAIGDVASRVGSLETTTGTLGSRVAELEKTPAGTDTALTARVQALEERNAADDAAAGGLAQTNDPGAGGGTSPPPLANALTITGDISGLQVGVGFTGLLTSDGVHPQFSVASGAVDGINVAPGGSVSGTPTTAGPYSMVVQSHDDNGASGSVTFNGTVADAAPPPAGDDSIVAGTGTDTVNAGTDTVNDPAGSSTVDGGAGDDKIIG